jgi:hypothetical protein
VVKCRSRQWGLLVVLALAAAITVGLVAQRVARSLQEPETIRREMAIVEDNFGPLPDNADEFLLRLEIAQDGSDGYLDIHTSGGWEHRRATWPKRRPPEALCMMQSVQWKSEFLGEFGTARWTNGQLGIFRQ